MKKFIQIRKEFHQIAEISENEFKTAEKVISILKNYQCEIITNVGFQGVLAVFDSGKSGKTLSFRAELDALPIHEENDFEYRSMHPGISHKCGHDGHLTGLLALAEKLEHQPPKSGRVVLIFQSAEENGEGAKAMFEHEKFKDFYPDYIFAYHNLPGYPLKEVVYKYESFTPAVTSIIIQLKGKTSHAAEPENGINPALALSNIVQKCLAIEKNDIYDENFSVITPIYQTLGSKDYGISAGEAEIHFTVRCWKQSDLNQVIKNIKEIAQKEAENQKLIIEFHQTQDFQANENHDEAIEILEKVIQKEQLSHQKRDFPFKWGEDFGLFTQNFKGGMFGIGSGEDCPALHNPDYDFPDDLIAFSSDLFFNIQKEILN